MPRLAHMKAPAPLLRSKDKFQSTIAIGHALAPWDRRVTGRMDDDLRMGHGLATVVIGVQSHSLRAFGFDNCGMRKCRDRYESSRDADSQPCQTGTPRQRVQPSAIL